MSRRAGRALAVLVTAAVGLTGCATVPGSSDVTVLRRVGDPAEPSLPPGPVRGTGPLETVRGWVEASGVVADRHAPARRFLAPAAAAGWDDGVAPTVISDRVDTVFADTPVVPGTSAVRVRANRLGTLGRNGAFTPAAGPLDLVVELTEQNGQWRISSLPPGTVVRHADLQADDRSVREWFVSAGTGLPVSDTRYLPVSPARTVAARALDLQTSGPDPRLAGAVESALPPGAGVRVGDPIGPLGTVPVDVDRLGPADDPRRMQLARQLVLTLADVGVARVRLSADGAPLLAGHPEVEVPDVLAGLPAEVRQSRDLPADPAASSAGPGPAPPLLATNGRLVDLGPAGPGEAGVATGPGTDVTALSAGTGPDGDLAVVAAAGNAPARPGAPAGAPPAGQRLLVGRPGMPPTPVDVTARTLTPPTWSSADGSVWTVADGTTAVRVPVGSSAGGDGGPGAPHAVGLPALAGLGPITSFRLSPDGIRAAVVAGGRVATAVVARGPDGAPELASVQVLRAGSSADDEDLAGVLDAAWERSDRLVVVGNRSGHAVQSVSADGLDLEDRTTLNLTPPVTAVTAVPGRPVLVVDQGGLWSLAEDGSGVWRSVPGGTSGAIPAYPS